MDQRRLQRLLLELHRTDPASPVLERLCAIGTQVTATDGAGVSRMSEGSYEVLLATDHHAELVEHLQAELDEGPCVDVFTSSLPSLEPDLRSDRALDRWPSFTPRARDHGIGAVFAFPLIASGQPLGAIDLYTERSATLSDEQLSDAMMLADLAALAVGRRGSPEIDAVDLHVEAAEAWTHPAVVHNATGMVSEQLSVDVDEALLRLRVVSFATSRPLAEVARDIVDRRLRVDSWASGE